MLILGFCLLAWGVAKLVSFSNILSAILDDADADNISTVVPSTSGAIQGSGGLGPRSSIFVPALTEPSCPVTVSMEEDLHDISWMTLWLLMSLDKASAKMPFVRPRSGPTSELAVLAHRVLEASQNSSISLRIVEARADQNVLL